MLDDATLYEALLREPATPIGLPPEAPLAMPRQVLERPPRWRRRWLRFVVRLAR